MKVSSPERKAVAGQVNLGIDVLRLYLLSALRPGDGKVSSEGVLDRHMGFAGGHEHDIRRLPFQRGSWQASLEFKL